jgi:hypothetical protein
MKYADFQAKDNREYVALGYCINYLGNEIFFFSPFGLIFSDCLVSLLRLLLSLVPYYWDKEICKVIFPQRNVTINL